MVKTMIGTEDEPRKLRVLRLLKMRGTRSARFGGQYHWVDNDLTGWVDGPMICHPAIGGSEGLRRLRELRADGYMIEMRRHPDRKRTTRQYRLR
jgi:hypothetical protein